MWEHGHVVLGGDLIGSRNTYQAAYGIEPKLELHMQKMYQWCSSGANHLPVLSMSFYKFPNDGPTCLSANQY